MKELSEIACNKKVLGVPNDLEVELLNRLSGMSAQAFEKTEALSRAIAGHDDLTEAKDLAFYEHDSVIPIMSELRAVADEMETLTAEKYWPFPSYEKLLFGV